MTGVFADAPVVSAIEGTDGSLELTLTNTSGTKFSGPVSVALYASTDNSVSSDDALITTIDFSKLIIRSGTSKTVKLKFTFPTSLGDGNYYVVGSITAVGTGTAAAEADALAAVSLATAKVDLSTTFTEGSTVTVNPGHRDTVAVTIENLGNVTANGKLDLNLYASNTSTLDATSAQILATLSGRVFHIHAGHSITLHLHFTALANEAAGAYYLVASNTSTTTVADDNTTNDNAAATTVAVI